MNKFNNRFKEKTAGVLAYSDLRTVKGQFVHWFFVSVLLFFCVITIVPSVWVLMTAFKDTQEIYSGFTFFPNDMSFNRFVTRIAESWTQLKLGETVLNTLLKSFGDWLFTLLFCGLAGFSLSKLKPKGHKIVFVLIIWTMMMPAQIRMVPNYITMLHFPFAYDIGGVNLMNTYWPLWLSGSISSYTIILFKNNFDALSTSYVEAARLDGCSNFGVFFRIMVPLSKSIIMFVSITALSNAWNDYFGPLIYLTDNYTLPLKLYKLRSDPTVKMNTYFMGLIFGCVPSILIFAIFQKQIIGGISMGGVKG